MARTSLKKGMEIIGCEDKKVFRIVGWSLDAIERTSSAEFVYKDYLPLIKANIESFEKANIKLGFSSEVLEKIKPLGVKKSWLKDLEQKGVLIPVFYSLFEIDGEDKWIKIWDLNAIDEGKIKKFVEEKLKELERKKEERRKKISKSLKELHKKVRKLKEEKEKFLSQLREYHEFLPYAVYLWHLNHYAKTSDYEDIREELYDIKTEVLLKAYRLYPDLFEISFIERGDRIEYCEDCVEIAYQEWLDIGGYYSGMTFGEFLRTQKPCENCLVEKDYYSLVEFKIDTPLLKVVYHLPYPIVDDFFKKEKLPKIDRKGEFIRYGRPVKKYEKLVFPLREVKKRLKEFLNSVKS